MEDRYVRQIAMDQIGIEGQRKLTLSSAVIVGAGGLGSPVLTYLAAAGVGRLGIIDDDTVSIHNLNRQFLHSESDIGRPKATSALETLTALNGGVEIHAHGKRLSEGNAEALLSGYDIILGAADSMDTRFVINKASVALGLPYIDGGVGGFNGRIVFSRPNITPCLHCVFPEASRQPQIGDKAKTPAGILGTTAGVIGALQANLALLWLLGLGCPIENKLLAYDGLKMRFSLIDIRRDLNCAVCGGGVK